MEKENMFISQMNQSSNNMNELSCWENIADQSGGGVDFFESALSSMVSSPTASNNNGNFGINNNGESVVLRELIGRLGSICNNNNSGEISPQPYNINNSNNTSCYSTPLSSPPKLNLSMMMGNNHLRRLHHDQIIGNMNLQNNYSANSLQSLAPQFSTDPGFAERAARFSCFANKNLGGFVPQLDSSSSSCPSSMVVSSSIHHQSLKNKEEQASVFPDRKFKTWEAANHEVADSRENSTVSEQINSQNDAKKRKSNARAKPAKDVPSETRETSAKRIKSEENGNEKDESAATKSNKSDANQKQSKDHNSKTNSEPPKDYIHVRARRGQATDAHSLAERVRREKISERMKLLQDLVPGCNKVTGKAVMLDEIINYVQSLQRQVEFISMKLATVNPRMDFNMESAVSKDMFQQSHASFPQNNTYASDSYPFQVTQANLHSSSVYNGSDQFFEASHYSETMPQVSTFMEDDLLSVVQMGFQKNVIAPSFDNGIVGTTAQMKVEQ